MPRIAVNNINLYYEFHGPEDGEVIVLFQRHHDEHCQLVLPDAGACKALSRSIV